MSIASEKRSTRKEKIETGNAVVSCSFAIGLSALACVGLIIWIASWEPAVYHIGGGGVQSIINQEEHIESPRFETHGDVQVLGELDGYVFVRNNSKLVLNGLVRGRIKVESGSRAIVNGAAEGDILNDGRG